MSTSSPTEFGNAEKAAPASRDFLIDAAALQHWMSENVEGFSGPLDIEKFKGGQSNPTYRVRTPQWDYVLRRKPSGALLKGAHAIDREARVMTALARTGFPVPHVYTLCMDESVIGSSFFIMEFIEGRIFWDGSLPDVPRNERAAYQAAMNATMATLHCIDPSAIGLGDYGRVGTTLGNPLADFAYNAMMYRMPSDILGGIGGLNAAAAGLLDEAAYVDAYCRRTGRSDIPDLDFYIAFNMFRFAAILHGIKARAARGTASSHDAIAMGERFARVTELAWAQVQRM